MEVIDSIKHTTLLIKDRFDELTLDYGELDARLLLLGYINERYKDKSPKVKMLSDEGTIACLKHRYKD